MASIAPVGNSIYCNRMLEMPLGDTLQRLLPMMMPTGLCSVLAGIILSFIVPPIVSLGLSRFQYAIPIIVHTLLFSFYFSRLGYGYVQGDSNIFGYSLAHYVLAPALIAGVGAFLHIALRPWHRVPHDMHLS